MTLDARPLEEQTLEDLLDFLRQKVGENLTLDYKREISPDKDKDKAELCKDVSALANAAGGMIVYGVAEEKPERTPALPPHGAPRYSGRQPIEEWAAQTLASGVQPPMDFEVQPYELPDSQDGDGTAERCVMVVRVGPSLNAPHMVTSRADNRYYGRFYRRGNYESRIAQEYEVREMLERARRLYEGVEGEIARRGYGDPGSPEFAANGYSTRLVTKFSHATETNELAARRVCVLLLPVGAPPGRLPRQDRREWVSWLNTNQLRYLPDTASRFLPGPRIQPTLGGIACLEDLWKSDGAGGPMLNKGLEEYLLVGFDGAVELGLSSVAVQRQEWGMSFAFFGKRILVRTWQAINFATDVRRRLGLTSSYLLVLSAKNTAGGILAGFDQAWSSQDPSVAAFAYRDAPRCLETNLQIRRELDGEDLEEVGRGAWASPPPQVRDISEELSSAFGLQDPVLLPR